MKRMIYLGLFFFSLSALWGCGTTREEVTVRPNSPVAPKVKITVADVSNQTGELFDVDVIGLLWTGIEETLNNRGMLWTGQSFDSPLKLEANIMKYQKGSIWMRCLAPPWGNTVLAVKSDLKDGERIVASVESKRTLSIGSGGLTIGAWRKIFKEVAEDLVNQLAVKM